MFNFIKRKKTDKTASEQTSSPLVVAPEAASKAAAHEAKPTGLFVGLKRTRDNLLHGVANIFSRSDHFEAAKLDELESRLLASDVGVAVTEKIIFELKQTLKNEKIISSEVALRLIKEKLENILLPCEQALTISAAIKPFAILFVGVNGTGKTTTIGKLAAQLQLQGKKIMLAAGDTFRAAAIDQLKVWGERNNVSVIAQQPGADSAAVIFDALQSARAQQVDVLIADTAGRFHTQSNLMGELKKIKRSMQKIDPGAPHEVMLVLDATTGQNALNQAKQFVQEIGVTGICLTKLDGTAKGGIIFAIAQQLKLPIRYVGVGETIADLKPFVAREFVDALFINSPC